MNIIKTFFKGCWKILNFIRNLVMNIVFIIFMLLLAGMFSLFASISPLMGVDKTETKFNDGALYLNLDGYLADNRPDEQSLQILLNEAIGGDTLPEKISTFDVIGAVRNAATDKKIQGLIINLNDFAGGDLPAILYLGESLKEFKATGKPVIAYADNYTQPQYLLASYADKIYLNPNGQVGITGFNVENIYFKELLDKLAITPHIFRVGTYKSAVEPFLRNDMSPAARENMQLWLGESWQDYLAAVADNREISKDQVLPTGEVYLKELTALKGDSTAYAKQHHLITDFADVFDFKKQMIDIFGETKDGKIKLIKYNDYVTNLPDRMSKQSKNRIAVINVEGAIIDGESDENGVGGDTIVRLLKKAYEDKDIKAVVLRVNSPGGSAFASELIRQGVSQLQKAGKPVVVSMGGMAASGGYWISSTADYIVAAPDTITGSIGIFGMLPTFEKAAHKIGVNTDGVATTDLAMTSVLSALPQLNADIIQQQIEYGYDQFLERVSEGRHMSKQAVDKIAQGQVWLGRDAYKHKLVDELGYFDAAVAKAKELVKAQAKDQKENKKEQAKDGQQDQAKVEKDGVTVQWLSDDENSMFERVLKSMSGKNQAMIKTQLMQLMGLPKEASKAAQQLDILNQFNDPKGQYLYCLTCGDLR